ncbi:MAG: MFS transporter [Candidatus Solibacter usitatus]|nr:MFS transporter [Candidatus Solibacter usitatus]
MLSPKAYKWSVVAMLWFVCVFNYADRQAIFSVFPLLKSEMGLSDVELSIVGSSFMWVYALGGPFAGMLTDRFKRKTLIIGGLVFWSAVTLAVALSQNYWQLVALRALQGMGEALFFPAAMSLISDYHGRDTRSRAMAINQSGVYAGTIMGGAVAGMLAQFYGWRSCFYIFGGLGIVLGVALLGMLREPVRGQAEDDGEAAKAGLDLSGGVWNVLKDTFAHPMSRVLMTVFIGANFVAVIFLTWMPSFLFRKFHMSLSMAGLNSTAYLQIASVCGVMTGGWLADKFARKHIAGRMWTQSIGLLAGVPFIVLTGWTLSVPVLIIAMSGFGYAKGLYDANIWASLYDVVKPERRGTALGFMNSMAWLGGSAGPVAVAYAAQTLGMGAAISASSLVYLLTGFLLLWGVRTFMRTRPA